MNTDWKTACAGIALLAFISGATAAPNGGHGTGSHTSGSPATSNRQSLPDADRSLERAYEREADQGLEHSRAGAQQTEHAPNEGTDHRNAHSLKQPGKTRKNVVN